MAQQYISLKSLAVIELRKRMSVEGLKRVLLLPHVQYRKF